MKSEGFLGKGLAFAFLTILGGCATQHLQPQAVLKDQGAFFGRIQVFNKGEDRTDACYAEFTNSEETRKAYLSVDKTGWVFASVSQGETYLSKVICTSGGMFPHTLEFKTRDMRFNISGNGGISYFGNIIIQMEDKSGVSPAVFFGAVGAAVSAANPVDATKEVKIENNLETATHEFASRYPNGTEYLKPIATIVSQPNLERQPATEKK